MKMIIRLIVLIGFMINIGCTNRDNNRILLLYCDFFPTGGSSEWYQIKIYSDTTLFIWGQKENQILLGDYVEINKKIKLSDNEYDRIVKLSKIIKRSPRLIYGNNYHDTWVVNLVIGICEDRFVKGEKKETPQGQLMLLIQQIVGDNMYLHGWS